MTFKDRAKKHVTEFMDQLKKDLSDRPPGFLSRQHVERRKQTRSEIVLCSSCSEVMSKNHFLGLHNSQNQWEPFCRECYDVTITIRRALEGNDG